MRRAKDIALVYVYFIACVCGVLRFYGALGVAIGVAFGLVKGFPQARPLITISACLLIVGLLSRWIERRMENSLEVHRETDATVSDSDNVGLGEYAVSPAPKWWPVGWPTPRRVALYLTIGVPVLNTWSWLVSTTWLKFFVAAEPIPSFVDHVLGLARIPRGEAILALSGGMLLGQMYSVPLLILVVPLTDALGGQKTERGWRWYGEFAGTNVTAAFLAMGVVFIIGLAADFLGFRSR